MFSKFALTVGILLMAIAGLFFAYDTASAGLDVCRGDPVLHLSNGKIMRIETTIGTSLSNVRAIEYEVHVPPGVKLVRVQWSGNPALRGLENLKFFDNAKPGQYTSDTVVKTTVKVAVTVTTTLDKLSNTVSGFSGQHLISTFNVP